MTVQRPEAASVGHRPKARPSPGPVRLAFGLGGVAALSALAAAIVLPPRLQVVAVAPTEATVPPTQFPTDTPRPSPTVRYIQLAPGETPPPGATVIPAPISSVATLVAVVRPAPNGTSVPRPAATIPPAPTPVKTTQSGKIVP
jgi:hypothetical protein